MPLCDSEPFYDQKTGPWCSGFLIAEDLIATAGHCITDQWSCDSTSFIFGFAKTSEDHDVAVLEEDDVYHCEELVDREEYGYGEDWALIKLDRPVVGQDPIPINYGRITEAAEDEVMFSTPLTVIGHPSGFPSKISDGSFVRSIEDGYLVANLDTYGGNSGFVVINGWTRTAEGILVRGETDYKYDSENGCYVSFKCEDDGCRGEDVTLINTLIPALLEYQGAYLSKEVKEIIDEDIVSLTQENMPAMDSTEDLKVGFYIEHDYVGDLTVNIIAPNGNKVALHNKTGFSTNRIAGQYSDYGYSDVEPAEALSNLGPQESGEWQLEVIDHNENQTGYIVYWYLIP